MSTLQERTPTPAHRIGWIDGHLDIAYVALSGRDVTLRCPDPDEGCLSFPDLAEAPVRVVLATIFTESQAPDQPCGYRDSADIEGAHAAGRRQLAWYLDQERLGHLRIIRSRSDLTESLAVAQRDARLAIVLLMECADPIRSPDEARWWHEQGVRVVGMSWAYGSRYAGGNASAGGLTSVGRELVAAFDELGVLHDASHLSDESFSDLLACTSRRIVATHSNCRSLLAPKERHLRDDQIQAIAARDGIIGLNLFGDFLATARDAMLDDCVHHVLRVAALVGAHHTGLGSDLDGGFTPRRLPIGVRHPRQYEAIADALRLRGWSETQCEGFRNGNWIRVLAASLQ